MIKLLLSGKRNILFIIIAWSLLVYVGYNVLTVEAATDIKEICKGFDSGEWNDDSNKCEFSKQGIKNEDDAEFDHVLSDKGLGEDYLAGIAAKEDAICDDEDADTTNIKLCMSEERELEGKLQQRDKILEKLCNKVDGKWTKDGCDTGGGDTPKADKFNDLMDKTPGAIVQDPQYGVIPFQQTPAEPEEVKPKLLVPSLLEGTLTKEQKEALSKENPDWEFKPGVNIPNSLEGILTQEQSGALSKDNSDIEYQWEDTASNPVPGTPSYVDPDEVEEEEEPVPVIEDWGNTVTTDNEETLKEIGQNIASSEGEEVHGGAELEYTEADSNDKGDDQAIEQIQEESDDNTDSSDSQDSSDSEDNSSDDGGDSSDSGDDSSSSDDGGDSGDSSESEE